MIKLRIGGVPEHFNLPWQLCAEAGDPERLGVLAHWRDYPDGSGAMAHALRAAELDAALLLTEGAVAGVASGGGFKIASVYTESPLIWGIHVPADSALVTVDDIRGRRYAISRRGSGSHLMAFVHARERGWPVGDLELVAVGNLEGAVEALAADKADVFFWERFMTQPLVDAGQFRRVGEFTAPWPAFVLCVADGASAAQRGALARVFAAVLTRAAAFAKRPDAAALIGSRYGLDAADAAAWLGVTRFRARTGVAAADLAPVATALAALGLIGSGFDVEQALVQL